MGTKFKKIAVKLHRASREFLLSFRLIIPPFLRDSHLSGVKINSKIYDIRGKKTLTRKRRVLSRDEKNEERFARFPLQSARCSR